MSYLSYPALQRLKTFLKIYPAEGRLVLLLVGMMMAATIGSSIGGASVDALFIKQFDTSRLPYIYIIMGVANFINLLLIAGLSGNISRSRLYTGLPIFMALILIGARIILTFELSWFYPVLYVGKEVLAALQSVFVWGMAGALLDARQAKRLYPLLTAGSIAGATLGSFSTPGLVALFHSENLLIAWVIALIAATFFVTKLISWEKAKSKAESVFMSQNKNAGGGISGLFEEIGQGYRYVRKSPLMGWWSLASILLAVLWFSLLLPFQRSVSIQYPNADDLTSFLGLFTGVQTILALLISLFLSNRLFARFGLLNMLVVFVFIYAAGFTSLLFFPAFGVVITARLIKLIWANSVIDPAWNAVYNAIPIERRDQTRSFVNAVPGQAGIIISGLLLVAGDSILTPQYLYLIGLVFSIFAILVIRKCRSAYLEALSDALRNGNSTVFVDQGESFNDFQTEAESIEVILLNLKSKDAGTRRISVELLGQIPVDQSYDALIEALKDKDVDVCTAALNSLKSFASLADLKPVTALLASPHPELRKHAIEVLHKFGSENKQVLTAVYDHLTDDNPAVRARAAVAIALSDDKDSVEKILSQMASSRKPAMRVEAIRAIGECWSVFRENKSIKSSFAKALSDPDPVVRKEAMSGLNDSPIEFFPYFLKALGDSDSSVRKAAALAVSRFGEPVLEILCQQLNNPHLEDAALLALNEMPVKSVENTIREYVTNKVQLALRDRVLANSIRSNRNIERSNLLMESVHARARRQAIFALRALDLLIENETITLAIKNIEKHKQLAYAFEALETLPDTDLVRPLIRLWEHTGSTVSNDNFPWDEGLIDDDAWIRACSAFAIPPQKFTELLEKTAKSDPDELVRETAKYTLAGGTMKTLKTLPMMERILFMQKIPLFAEMSPEDLKKVASVATEKFFPDGDYLARKGDTGHEMYIVISGELGIISETGDEIASTPPGGYAGEMAILSQEPRSASLLAKGDVRVLSIGQKEFEEILRERPDASLAVIRELCSRLRKL